MAVNLSPVGGVAAQFFDNSGQVLTGGKLYTYLAGTTTPAVTYTTNSGISANSNPIVLNAAGRVADSGEIWLTDGINYKFVLKDSNDVQIAVWDNISGINSNFVNYTLQEQTFTATQGQTVFTLTGGIQYTPGTNNLSVFVNGSKQVAGTNYLETSSTVFTFLTGLNVGDVVEAGTSISVATNVASSANVSYNQGGTGAVTTNVQAKLQQTVSVKDFGAVGNGTIDDTVAIANAVTAISATGGCLYFPQGTYKYTNFVIAASNVNVRGDGWGVTVLQPSGWVDGIRFALGYTLPTTILTNVGIRNLTIDGVNQTAGANDTYGNGVNINGCDQFFCDYVQVINVKQQSIVSTYFPVGSSTQTSGFITNNLINASLSNNISLGVEGNCHNIIISNNRIENLSGTNQVGIYAGNLSDTLTAGDISITNNNISGTVGTNCVGIVIQDVFQKVLVSGNYVYGLGTGIRAQLVNTLETYDYAIVSNLVVNWTTFGIIVFPLGASQNSQALISSNSVFSANASVSAIGINIQNNCFVSSNKISASGMLYGVRCEASSVGSVVTGNYITGASSYAINVGTATGVVLLSNYCDADVQLNTDTVSYGGAGYSVQRWTTGYIGIFKSISNPNGNSAPASGTWIVGDKVWNTAPASGGYIGYVCTVAGTPGTWKTFGLIS